MKSPKGEAVRTPRVTIAFSSRLYALFALALGTGVRQGELLGTRWDSIDLDRQQLTVRHSLAEVQATFILKEPKSKRSRRTVKTADVSCRGASRTQACDGERGARVGILFRYQDRHPHREKQPRPPSIPPDPESRQATPRKVPCPSSQPCLSASARRHLDQGRQLAPRPFDRRTHASRLLPPAVGRRGFIGRDDGQAVFVKRLLNILVVRLTM